MLFKRGIRMNYEDIKIKMDVLTKEINKKRVQLKEKQTENEKMGNERQKLQMNFDNTLRIEQHKAFDSYQQRELGIFDQKLALYNSKMELAKQKHDAYLESLSVELIRDKFTDECQKFESIKNSLDLIDGKITEILGERFKTELYNNLDAGTISLDDADIDVFTLHFDRLLVTLDKIKKPEENSVKLALLKVVNSINLEKFKDNKLSFYLLIIVLMLVTFFATYIVSSVFCIFLFILFCSNLVKSYNVYTSIISYKAVKDNIDVFDKKIEDKCKEIYDRQVKNENIKYDKFIQGLRTKIEEATLGKAEKQAALKDEFNFDSSKLRDDFQAQLDNKNALISQNTAVLDNLRAELSEMNDTLNNLNIELKNALQSLYNSYISEEIGEDKKFNPRFLFNGGAKPEFFVHSKQSSAFIAETYDISVDFVRLLCAQLRTKILPTNYSITVIDTLNMGVDFMQFVDEKHANNFKILVDPEQIQNYLIELETTLKKRNQSMTVKYKTIDNYNDEMLKNDSVTESFLFVFVVTGYEDLLNNLKFLKLLSSGGNLGIYIHCFFEHEVVAADSGLIKTITKQFNSLYLLSERDCVLRDPTFLLRSYSGK